MDRGAWRATVMGSQELDINKQIIVDLQYGFPKKMREKLVINYHLRIFPFMFLL